MNLPREYADKLDAEDLKLLALINRKPYKAYSLSDFLPPTKDSLLEREEMTDEMQTRLNRLSHSGLIREKTLYFSPKAKI